MIRSRRIQNDRMKLFIAILLVAIELVAGSSTTMKSGERILQKGADESTLQILWINSDDAELRRNQTEEMFTELDRAGSIEPIRISATTRPDVLQFLKDDKLVLPGIELIPGKPNWMLHQQNKYTHVEAACLISHIRAIKTAYESGQNMALILEDDMIINPDFLDGWYDFAGLAPDDWQVLQFFTNNPMIALQSVKMTDPWISWQPEHFGTSAYLINRAGMVRILEQTVFTGHEESDVGVVLNMKEPKMLVADEILFYLTKSYTTTYPWVLQRDVASSIQEDALISFSETESLHKHRSQLPPNVVPRTESILVFMTMKMDSRSNIDMEMARLILDVTELSKWNTKTKWIIHAVAPDQRLQPYVTKAISMVDSDCIEWHEDVRPDGFNKFELVAKFTGEMDLYDYVLIKDSSQRIAGFPWNTWMEMTKDAVISGALKENPNTSLSRQYLAFDNDILFRLYDAKIWKDDKFAPREFEDMVSVSVPFLPQHFVMLDGGFAKRYFDEVLLSEFLAQPDHSGPELMWCAAAKEYLPDKTPCIVVPLTSSCEPIRKRKTVKTLITHDSRYILKESSDKFATWMMTTRHFLELIGFSDIYGVWTACDTATYYMENKDLTICVEKCKGQRCEWGV